MKVKSNDRVVLGWTRDEECVNHTRSLRSSQGNLWSYNQLIGITADSGQKIVFDYTAKGEAFISQTTSTHVGRASRYADQCMNIQAAKLGGLL